MQAPANPEKLVIENGKLVEELLSSQAWRDIAMPLLEESIAGVSGRLTNGRFHHGDLTKDWSANQSVFFAGYQKALMDYFNHLQDFVVAKDNLIAKKKREAEDSKAPIYNPYMEELNEAKD